MIFNLHEFREFLESGEGVATNILSDRLKTLSSEGIISSIKHPTNGTKKLYYLTEKGKSLYPLMRELILWGDENCEGSRAPQDKIDFLRNHAEAAREELMGTLTLWEEEHLPGIPSVA